MTDEKAVEVATYRHFGSMPCKNELYALSVLGNNHMARDFFAAIPDRDIPVILVGAGPSLDKNAAELLRAKGRAIIISATHALRTLQKYSVIPDILAEIDPKDFDFLGGLDTNGMLAFLSSRTSRKTQICLNGRAIYYDFAEELFPFSSIKGQPGNPENPGSVMNEFFDLFRLQGFNTFILVGQDLAYGADGSTHGSGEMQIAVENNTHFTIEGIGGESVESRADWIRFIKHYEKQIALQPGIRVIDATEGGAKINGTEIMSLAQAIDECCKKGYPLGEWLAGLSQAMSPEEAEEVKGYMRGKIRKLYGIRQQIEDALLNNRRLQSMVESGAAGSEGFGLLCTRYDGNYHAVLDADGSEILIYYSEGVLQDYLQDQLACENDITAKLVLDEKMFLSLKAEIPGLISYMEELFENGEGL